MEQCKTVQSEMGLYTQKLQGMDELCTAPAEIQDIDQKNECQTENTIHYHHSIVVFHVKVSPKILPRGAKRLEQHSFLPLFVYVNTF